MTAARPGPVFWAAWLLATATTGIVAGFFLGHALLLGRFLDWMLATGNPGLLPSTYPVFRATAGRVALEIYYGVAGLQVLSGLAFLAVALATRRQRAMAAIAALGSILWPVVHYGSGFAAVEAAVLRSTTPAPPETVRAFLSGNLTIHTFHAVALTLALVALLMVPLAVLRR